MHEKAGDIFPYGSNEIAGDGAHACRICIQRNLHGYFLRRLKRKDSLPWDMTLPNATVGKMSTRSNGDSFIKVCGNVVVLQRIFF